MPLNLQFCSLDGLKGQSDDKALFIKCNLVFGLSKVCRLKSNKTPRYLTFIGCWLNIEAMLRLEPLKKYTNSEIESK